jgi:hypothetical protein
VKLAPKSGLEESNIEILLVEEVQQAKLAKILFYIIENVILSLMHECNNDRDGFSSFCL